MERLFDIEPIRDYKVLSASRMTDMPKFYPAELIEEVEARRKKGMNIHSLVLWTKHPESLLKPLLSQYLEELKKERIQLYIQLTITGLGNVVVGKSSNGDPIVLEPGAPDYLSAFSSLPDVIDLVEKPERIRLRIDPIVRIRDSEGKLFTSIGYFKKIVEKASVLGLKTFSFSFLEKDVHKKVDRQLRDAECEIVPPDIKEREKTAFWMKELENQYGVSIFSCSVPHMPVSKCIDGELLTKLHDRQYPVGLKQQKKRELCGCTESIDIGGWPPRKCFTGCLYCYANAAISF